MTRDTRVNVELNLGVPGWTHVTVQQWRRELLDAKYRIYAELLRLSKPVPGYPDRALVSPPPAHTEIAARVSIRREAVAREIKALERAGIIGRRPGALVLVDTNRLRKMITEASEAD